MILPSSAPDVNEYWKFGPTDWYLFPGAQMLPSGPGGREFVLNFQDGGLGDASGVDGVIIDPGGPAFVLRPSIAADTYAVNEDQPLSVPAPGLLGNDTSASGAPLTATLVNGPMHGSLTLHADGSFSYMPELNFHGSDSFSYRTGDGQLDSAVAAATITVNSVNDAPVAAISGPQNGLRGQPHTFVLTATDVEPEEASAVFTYSIDWNGDGNVDESFTGSASATVDHIFESSGTYNVQVTATDQHGAASATASHLIRIAEIAEALPRIDSVVINDGHAQRSKINSITVTFDSPVSIDPGAFELRRQGTNTSVGLVVALREENARTVAVLTFSGHGIIGGSLFDGRYTLLIRGDKIRGASGQSLDGDGDGIAGNDRREEFFRRFGDSDGDGDVDRFDAERFQFTFGRRRGDSRYLWYLDFEDDGRVSIIDLLAFTVASIVSPR
jgi:hypothetical protein